MEGDEMEMSKEELHRWIRAKVKSSCLVSPEVVKRGKALQLLLERREGHAARLLKLCESVAAFEVIVKKQYSWLGLEYSGTESDDDDDKSSGCGHLPPPPCESAYSQHRVSSSPAANSRTPLGPKRPDTENLNRDNGKKYKMKRPNVVLTRLPKLRISAPCPQTPPSHSEEEIFSDSGSDTQWEPADDSSDSDFSNIRCRPKKKRKISKRINRKVSGSQETTIKTHPESCAAQTSAQTSAPTSAPPAKNHTVAEENSTKTLTPPANAKASEPAAEDPPRDPPRAPQGEVVVNMTVLARRRANSWQQGKILQIRTKEDGSLKYKVSFERNRKSLVSSHHIAFVTLPVVQHLFVGARVVVKCNAEHQHFSPAVLAELPCRKNKLRFLVFMDDKTPMYVALYSIRLVYRPFADPWDDIEDDTHRNFVKEFMKSCPQLLVEVREGSVIKAEYNGVQQKCTVLEIDCSLVQVIFENDQHEECLYRGSPRLEHINTMKKQRNLKRAKEQKN